VRALCIARHRFLSDHLCRFFGELGFETVPAVGLAEALELARCHTPDLVLCDYDLLATLPLGEWECDERVAHVPVVAVSLTRRPAEMHPLDVNAIGGVLYLPTLDRERVLRVLASMRNGVSLPVADPLGLSRPPSRVAP
jgi:DNA-binding response OmpR family regulator